MMRCKEVSKAGKISLFFRFGEPTLEFTLIFLPLARTSIKKFYTQNRHLGKMKPPFNTHYFYFLLAVRLEERIKKLFENYPETTIKITGITLPTSADSYLRHRGKPVDETATAELRGLLFLFLGINSNNSRPAFKDWDLEKIKSWKHYKEYCGTTNGQYDKIEDWIIQPGQLKKFWLKAKGCNNELKGNPISEDVNVPLMNLLSFFCGYEDFRDFLFKEFGDQYSEEKDPILRSLYETYGYQLTSESSKDIQENYSHPSRPSSEKPHVEPSYPRKKFGQRGMVKLLFSVLALVISVALVFYLSGRIKKAEVKMKLTIDFIQFETHEAVNLRPLESFLLSTSDHFYLKNGQYSLNYPFKASSPETLKITTIQSEPVGISYLKIPGKSKVTIETPTKNEIYLDFSEHQGMEGHVILRNLILQSTKADSTIVYHNTPLGTGINFQSSAKHSFGISLIRAHEFELPPLLVNTVGFSNPALSKTHYGIIQGEIELPEYGSTYTLNPQDLLTMTTHYPGKLILSYQQGQLSAQFSGSLKSLETGINSSETSYTKNLMPTRFEAYKFFYIALIAILAFIGLILGNYTLRLR